MPAKKAFTLIEVLLAVLLLFTAGLALMKIQRRIVDDLQTARHKAVLLQTVTPVLSLPVEALRKRSTPLYRLVRFKTLRDDEIFFLKNLRITARRAKPRRETLFETLRYNVWPVTVSDTKGTLRFIRITP
ncbi:MAG: hypothetical protein GXO33_05720 [Epsilonproteobacteria bacterium]|nr:hypothetical protein [Campylobacterota bacterium]